MNQQKGRSTEEYLRLIGVASLAPATSPFDPGHDESAWAKNRRAHFVVTSK